MYGPFIRSQIPASRDLHQPAPVVLEGIDTRLRNDLCACARWGQAGRHLNWRTAAESIVAGVVVLTIGWLSRHLLISVVGRARKWIAGLIGPRLYFVHQRCRRMKGGWGSEPATSIMMDFWVTSTYDRPVAILRGEVRYWQGFRRRTFSRIQIETVIHPRRPADFRAQFPITPPPVPDDKPFRAAVFFIDNYSKRHKAETFTFATHEPGQVLPPD